jgi:hypothetical protein
MKAVCKYTGLELLSSSGFARWVAVSEHPIFSIPLADTLELACVEWSPEMFVLDKKLLLLAIAKNCELISWQEHRMFPANPSPATVENCIDMLVRIAGWIDFQRSVKKHSNYPSLLITEETADMKSLWPMLNEIINSRDYTEKQERREHRLVCLENNARNLSAKCTIGANKEKALLSTVAEWAMMVTEDALKAERVDTEIRAVWKTMLMTPATQLKAKGFSITDVEELHDFLTDHLPHGSVIAHDVIAHTQRLLMVNSFTDIDGGTILSARILNTGALTASTSEPLRSEFPSLIEFARARSKWLLVEMQRDETAKELAKLDKKIQAQERRELDNENDI